MFGTRASATWSFVLDPIGDEATQLTVRVRGSFEPSLRSSLARPAIFALHTIMEHAQLRNLKHRAERLTAAEA